MTAAAPATDHGEPGPIALSEARTVLLAALTWAGAVAGWPVPVFPAVVGAGTALLLRRPLLVLLTVPLLAAALGHRADRAWQPVAPGSFRGSVSLLTDPEPVGPVGQRAMVRLPDRRRVELTAYGEPAFDLDRATVGDRFEVTGRLRPVDDRPWNRSRHLVGRLAASGASPAGPPAIPWRAVAAVRDRIVAGADRLAGSDRDLYLGLVVGDDRFQTPARRARFRAAGLTHLLAVSGQNVAFVLAVTGPVVRSLGGRWREAATGVVLVLFALVTRMEPSVLRATATAGLATLAATDGHRQSGIRLLALAVTGLVLLDPFLTVSVGFQLSVAASGGILVLGPPLASRCPLPTPLAEPLVVTVAAQAGVLPLLLAHFGPVSAASIPANVLAGWAAGAVMTWGLTVGVVAGLAPPTVGEVLQWPAHLLMWWLDRVAAWACRLPLPLIDTHFSIVLLGLGVAWWAVGSTTSMSGRIRRGARSVVVGVLIVASVAAVPDRPSSRTSFPGGWWLPPADGRPGVLVISADADDDLLTALLANQVDAVDLVVSEDGGGRGAETAGAVAELVSVGTLLAPGQHRIVGAVRATRPLEVVTAHGTVIVEPDDHRLAVTVR